MKEEIIYFWQTEYKFGEFLKEIFPTQYKRKFSLEGNGIYNLLFINNNVYDIVYKQAKTKKIADSKVAVDKKYIVDTIVKNLKCNKENIIVSSGKFIQFPVGPWLANIEIIKKQRVPN